MTILREPVRDASAWRAGDFAKDRPWLYELTPEQIDEIEQALAYARARGRDGYEIRRDDFPLPRLQPAIRQWLDEVDNGRGFLVVRGLPIERLDEPSLYALYWGLGTHFGDAMVQNYEGRRINEVRSRGHSYEEVNIRAYATASHLGFHSDPSDMACLLCVRQAKIGGLSRIASATAIYNDILADHPEFLEPLCHGFHHDVRGEGPTGDFDEVTETAIPIYSFHAGKLSCCLNTKSITTARMKMGGELSTLERDALDYIEQRAMQPDMRFEFMLQPGDMSMISNYSVLHARTAFEDWPEPERKRTLLRLWINLHEGRDLADDFTGRFNTGHRGGAVVQAHSDAALIAAGRSRVSA